MRAPWHVRPWMLVSAAWIGPAVLGGLDVVMQHRLRGGQAPPGAVLFVSLDWLLYALLTPGAFAIARQWPLARPYLPRRIALHLGASILFCAAWAGAGTVLKAVFEPTALGEGAGMFFASWLFITLPFGVVVYLAMVGIEHATRYFADARERALQVARLSEQLSSARFAALQAQLNPHFLFNTLNTITVLIRDGDRTGAVAIVQHLSDILRRTLQRHRADEVRLDEELDLVRQYLAIEQARFPDRLTVAFDIAAAARSSAVPSFALQHLVENAIRHGIAPKAAPGHVVISARRVADNLDISVVDDGPGIDETIAAPAGHGIQNTRERLRALYGARASLTLTRERDGRTRATLRVPYREIATEVDDG